MVKGKVRKKLGQEIKEEKEEVKKSIKKWWIFGLVGIIVVFLILIALYNYQQSHFKYLDLEFSKIKMSSIPMSYAKIPLYDQNGNIATYYRLYLRNDPRDLEDVPINGQIRVKEKIVMASDEIKCEDANIAGAQLGDFWGSILQVTQVMAATTNRTLANEKEIEYATCNTKEILFLDSTVLIFKNGNTTKITQEAKDCYEITVKDCEILRATERFILGLYAHTTGQEIN